MNGHAAQYEVVQYPGVQYTAKVVWKCACGKRGQVNDGIHAASIRRARSAHRRHVAAVTKEV